MSISDDNSGSGLTESVTSETDLFNDALGMIGQNPIRMAGDGSVSGSRCMTFYTPLRKGLLRSHRWNFAERRAQLAQLVTAPTFGYGYSHQLPADCLRVWEYNGVGVQTNSYSDYYTPGVRYQPMFKVEGRSLVSNAAQAYIVYSRDINNPSLWDAMFYQVVVTWLASKLAASIPKNDSKADTLMKQAVNVLLPMALAADGQEGSTEPFQADALTWGRM
jgi:hypothetical protein